MMTSETLRHLVRVITALAPGQKLVLFGSMSALVSFPGLDHETTLYETTLDADFIPEPWNEGLILMLHDAVGRQSLFSSNFGYHADFVRPEAFENFPPGFRERLVPVADFQEVFALEPHDMAVAKLFAGRPKDVRVLAAFLHMGLISESTLRKRLWDTPMTEKWIVKTHAVLEEVVVESQKLKNLESASPDSPADQVS